MEMEQWTNMGMVSFQPYNKCLTEVLSVCADISADNFGSLAEIGVGDLGNIKNDEEEEF